MEKIVELWGFEGFKSDQFLPIIMGTASRQIESLSSFDPVSQRVKHLLIGHANDLEMDGSGRILLPQELRQYAQLEKHVCLIGQGKKLEIWSQDIWNQQRDQWLTESTSEGELPDKLRALAL